MVLHQQRLLAIAGLLGMCLIGLVLCLVTGVTEGTVVGVFGTGVTLLLPAFLDAAAVERRRRDPELSALPDDVRKDAVEGNSGASGD